jgi:hypothetical protein
MADGGFDPGSVAQQIAQGGLGRSGLASSSAQNAYSGGFQAGGYGNGGDVGVPMVYRGKRTMEYPTGYATKAEEGGRAPVMYGHKVGDYQPADEASASWYDMDDEERKAFADYLIKIGAIDPEDAWNYDALQELWEKGIELSSGYTARGKDVTPEQALATWVGWDGSGESAAARARAAAAAEDEPFTGSRTARSTSINLSDPASAKALANYVVSKALGREALPEELAAYRDALNDYERENPSVTTTTATYKEGIETDQKSTTRGGATAAGSEQILTDIAREEEDYAEYQAAGPIWNAFLSALQSPVSMG